MAEPSPEASSKPGLDFIDNSRLSYFIPLATDFDPVGAFRDGSASHEEIIEGVERRESLFFDESVHVYLILRTPYVERDTLKSSLRRLVLSLEAQIVNGHAPGRDTPPSSEIIYSNTLDSAEDPVILGDTGQGHIDGDEQQYIHALWKLSVFLSRPRMRLQSPSVVFTATGSLKPADVSLSNGLRDGYLPSGVASGLNLLESFAHDPAMNGVKPRLSALRVSRVAPVTQQAKDLLRPIKSLPKLSLRIYPVVHSRIRFTHSHTAPSTSTIVAMLEVDFTSFFECEIILDDINLSISDGGTVQDLTKDSGMSLPLSCVAYDHVTFLYLLNPEACDMLPKNPNRNLDIQITGTALVEPGVCQPRLALAWTASVDFTIPVNPGYGSAMQPIQRSHRPSQLSIGGESTISLTAPSVARPDALPVLEAATTQTEAPVRELGVTMTFTAPPPSQKIYLGDEFFWNVFVVNRAPTTSVPRKLALVVIPKRRRNESRVTRPPSISRVSDRPHGTSYGKTHKDRGVAEAVLDENVLHAMQRSSVVDNADLVCLSADVRIGPLAPGACHAVDLKFLALNEGIITVEAVRVIDIATNEHVDIRELPSVVVERRPDA
ncbi:TRAPP trafficking subunit Trs65-domain-containing protein [Xylariomycetidae sp. FL2044]|nr:TRAPP trafficking subunit Trs65-domain-containing protein [Xylariomycetidae sp. FL2044]